jgi:hypothetical protein
MGIDTTIKIKTKAKIADDILRDLNYRFMELGMIHYGNSPISLSQYSQFPDGYCYKIDSLERYYGIGYERGHWPNILMSLKWLKHNIPDSIIYYGGDDWEGDDEFTDEVEKEITNHWLNNGGLPYRERPNEFGVKCPTCKKLMTRYMWGGDRAGIVCLGCRYKLETSDNGKNWIEIKKD